MTDNPIERLHSERGPSAAHRWRPCPGSVALCRGLPDDAGIEAALGTVFHEFAALTLEFDVDQHQMVGSLMEVEADGKPIVLEFSQEMATKMQPGVDWIRSYEGPGTLLLVEKRLDLQEWVGEGEFGTSDAGIIDIENWRIVVFDWKWGAGVPVGPYMNDQAMLYFPRILVDLRPRHVRGGVLPPVSGSRRPTPGTARRAGKRGRLGGR